MQNNYIIMQIYDLKTQTIKKIHNISKIVLKIQNEYINRVIFPTNMSLAGSGEIIDIYIKEQAINQQNLLNTHFIFKNKKLNVFVL